MKAVEEVEAHSEILRLRKRVAQLEDALYQEEKLAEQELYFAMRQTDRLISLGVWEPGQQEPNDEVFKFAQQVGMA